MTCEMIKIEFQMACCFGIAQDLLPSEKHIFTVMMDQSHKRKREYAFFCT